MKKRIISSILLVLIALSPLSAFADVVVGDVVVSLGDSLTESEKEAILQEFDPPEGATFIVTTNAEEHEYLGGVVPAGKIGNNAISSVMITYTAKGSGLNVETSEKITYITDSIYTNALITAGVEDADIKITAPKNASGTAALTGIMKAYEIATGEVIDEDIKKIANEEMVRTAELGEILGEEKASDLINKIKEQIAQKDPKTEAEIKEIIESVAKSLNITLTDKQLNQLVDLFNKMKGLDIDWKKVASGIKNAADKAGDFLKSEEGQSFLVKLKSFLSAVIDWIASLFK